MPGRSQGHIMLWQGGSLWIGRSDATTTPHEHHAIQVSLALEGRARLWDAASADAGPDLAAAIVAPDRAHAFAAEGATVAMIFVEPESVTGRAILKRHGGPGVVTPLDPAHLQDLPAGLRASFAAGDRDAMARLARQAVDRLAGADAAARRLEPDPRVRRVIRMLAARTGAPPALTEAAAEVRLSPGRLRHLFIAETGLHYSGYVLWLRLERAVAVFAAGGSLTDAAHAVGFADSAHLSRTFRRMFGLAPSSLQIR